MNMNYIMIKKYIIIIINAKICFGNILLLYLGKQEHQQMHKKHKNYKNIWLYFWNMIQKNKYNWYRNMYIISENQTKKA